MEVVIVGGSLTGLMHGIVLKGLGHRVHIVERSTASFLKNQAGGIRAGADVQTFIETYIQDYKPYSITVNAVTHLDRQGHVSSSRPANGPMYLTGWSQLHHIFKTELLSDRGGPEASYNTGELVQSIDYDGEKVTVTYTSTQDGSEAKVIKADLLVAADGGHSTVRRILLPEVHPAYSGYVTWRGAVQESAVSEQTRDLLLQRVIIFRTEKRGYVVCYNIPSDSGSLRSGETQFVWIWYDMFPEDSADFEQTFTDRDGKKHFTTIPRGNMQQRIWERRREYGQSVLNPPLAELLSKTTEPFVSAVRDCISPKAVFHDGRVLLTGDAFSLFRPHVGFSTNQGAKQALGLGKVFNGEASIGDWEKEALEYARSTSEFSVVFGEFSFTGVPTPLLRQYLKFPPTDQGKPSPNI